MATRVPLVVGSDGHPQQLQSGDSLLATALGTLPGGRLTTESGVGVSTSDRTGQSSLKYTPHLTDYLRLYDGVRVREYSFAEFALTLSGLTSGKNYDAWGYDSAGSPALDLTAWTNDTTRATALAWQTGLGWTKSGDAARLYLGTIRTTGTTTTEDSATKRFVWNAYNPVERKVLAAPNAGGSWTRTAGGSWSEMYQSGAATVGVVSGLPGLSVTKLRATGFCTATTAGIPSVGIGKNSATTAVTPDGGYRFSAGSTAGNAGQVGLINAYSEPAVLGYTYYVGLHLAETATMTFYGVETGGTGNGRFGTSLAGEWYG